MEYTVLKGTGIKVSKACVGTMTFGGQMDEKAACQAVDYAIEQGVNFFDTANLYYTGESERILGKALLGKRQDMIVTTKVSFPMSGCLNHEGLSRVNILRCVEESLKRLQTDYIDIYFLHKPDHTTPLEESLQAMDMLVRQGKVRYIGLSNYSAWKTCDALHICKEQNMVAPSVTEMVYNMLTRTIEPEYVPMLKEKRLGLMIYNPLAGGLLTGRHLPGHEEADSRFTQPAFKAYPQRYLNEENFNAVAKLMQIAQQAGISLAEMAMRWCISQEVVDSLIMGFSKMQQLQDNLQYLQKGALTNDVLQACDEVYHSLAGTRFAYFR